MIPKPIRLNLGSFQAVRQPFSAATATSAVATLVARFALAAASRDYLRGRRTGGEPAEAI